MSAHTPGPWRAVETYVYCSNPDGRTICQVNPFGDAVVYLANARLIAAAPELLASLRDCRALAMLTERQKDDPAAIEEILEKAFNVILKAEGRE